LGKELYTVEQAAEKLQVDPETIRIWLRAGKLKGIKVGRLWRIREENLELFLGGGDNK